MNKKLGIVALLLAGLPMSAALASNNLYMLIPGITGSATAEDYRGWIDVSSFSLGYQKATCESLSVEKGLDMTSPALTVAAVAGTFYPTVTLVSVRNGAVPYEEFRLRLFNAAVISVQQSGSDETPTESLSFQPTSVEVTYIPVSQDGRPMNPVVSTVDCQTVKVK